MMLFEMGLDFRKVFRGRDYFFISPNDFDARPQMTGKRLIVPGGHWDFFAVMRFDEAAQCFQKMVIANFEVSGDFFGFWLERHQRDAQGLGKPAKKMLDLFF